MGPRGTAALVGVGLTTIAVGVVAEVLRRKRKRLGLGGPKPSESHASPAGTLKVFRGSLPIGERVHLIQRGVAAAVRDPSMRKLALEVTQNCPARDGDCEARAVFDWVAENVRYTGDIGEVVLNPARNRRGKAESVDLYQTPARTVEYRGGDCDDHAALASALLALNGITPELDVTSNECKTHDHILAVAKLPKNKPAKRVPVDTTLGAGQFGAWPRYCSKRTFPA